MKKRFTYLWSIILTVFTGFSLSFSAFQTQVPLTSEYMIPVSSVTEANELAQVYDLTLIEVIANQLAVYENLGNSAESLIAAGFLPNTSLSSTGPAWKTPVDPYLDEQINLDLTDVPEAWSYTTGSADVVIAIIDTGIDTAHEEFTGRISSLSYNTVTNTAGLTAIVDDYGHGTMVAGIIGANKDNYKGIAGVTQNTVLLVIKSNTLNEGSFKDSDIIEGIYYAVDHGADIINLSLGSTYANPLTQEAINYAYSQGVVVIGAAGNDGNDALMYPASFDHVVSVSALDNDLSLADYSSFGTKIDVGAPGSDVITTAIGGSYASVSGTSFAAPLVSGIVGLYLSLYPDATVDEVTLKLLGASMDDGDTGWDEQYGYGVVNAKNLVSDNFYEIHFVNDPGIGLDVAYVRWQDTLQRITLPSLVNQIFVGYFLDPQFLTMVSMDEPVTSDMTLYAKYSDAFHTITLMEGAEVLNQYVQEHASTVTLPILEKDGFRFLGWFLDVSGTIEYVPSSLLEDLTVYAIFEEIPVYQLTYVVFDEIVHQMTLREDQIISDFLYEIVGYDFYGWYLDQEYSILFESTTANSDLILYGKYQVRQLTVTYQLSETVLHEEVFPYGNIPTLWDSGLENFAGWYLNPELSVPYEFTSITDNLTLYAKIATGSIEVRLNIDGVYAYSLYFGESDEIIIDSLSWDGKIFHGWYLDSNYSELVDTSTIQSNTTIYGYFEDIVYVVTYYASDMTTILYRLEATYGTLVHVPEPSQKPASLYFDYVFTSWSENLTQVTKNVDVFPIYESVFKQGSVWIMPGVDTIEAGQEWTDGGISDFGDELSMTSSQTVDSDIAGSYRVEYFLSYEGEVVAALVRMVHVLEKPADITITLNPGISTIVVGDSYVEAGAKTNIGTIQIIGEVDPSTIGEYTIVYRVEIDGYVKETIRIVSVISQAESNPLMTILFWKEENIYA